MSNGKSIYWFLGASYGANDDQTERFVKEGIWQNGDDNKYHDDVKKIKAGDKIAIKSVYTKTYNLPFDNDGKMASVMDIKAIGEVTENLNDGINLKVKWDTDFSKKTWYFYTYRPRIWKVTADNPEKTALIDFVFNNINQNFDLFLPSKVIKNSELETPAINEPVELAPLNSILYGPPGTGKTFNTVKLAVDAVDPYFAQKVENDQDLRATYKEYYEELKQDGQIRFLTFHQSFGYEEFVEGLKASSDNGSISYDVEDGVFKQIVIEATKYRTFQESTTKHSFDSCWEAFCAELAESEFVEVPMSKVSFKVIDFNDKRIFFEKQGGSKDHTLSINTLRAIFNGEREYKSGLGVYYRPLVSYLKDLVSATESNNIERKNFVLIIDEINRGNISKIFGELITLIEPSKRLGKNEKLDTVLPYSGDVFSVPDNLYIIGTMNTADRSLAMMDTALRRRFDFIEMMPQPELFKGKKVKGIDLEQLLGTMNKRIEVLYDREHTLGHAFLIPVLNALDSDEDDAEARAFTELKNTFKNKIIPLLEEYFFEDWNKIRLVLGDNRKEKSELEQYIFVKSKSEKYNDIFGENHSLETYEDTKTTFTLADFNAQDSAWNDPIAYQAIYDDTLLKSIEKISDDAGEDTASSTQ
ncbi:McrB family protein [Pseudoalteromonas tetraodonis]|uniref:McrB family protein n=1 Tax=Pseudoalteromonas tetraodonis TaxID=43659 RepID=UPI000AA39A3A|nr:AAA family ATPase [Pseudoalteromonas tetraodonis]